MTPRTGNHAGCPDCRLRLASDEAAYLIACPECGKPLQPLADLSKAVGFRLFKPEDTAESLPEAVTVSMQIPDPGTGPIVTGAHPDDWHPDD